MGQTDLPDPQSEWEDALGRIELENLKRAQAALVAQGLDDPKSIEQYQELARRIHGLTRN
jgi:DNA primase